VGATWPTSAKPDEFCTGGTRQPGADEGRVGFARCSALSASAATASTLAIDWVASAEGGFALTGRARASRFLASSATMNWRRVIARSFIRFVSISAASASLATRREPTYENRPLGRE